MVTNEQRLRRAFAGVLFRPAPAGSGITRSIRDAQQSFAARFASLYSTLIGLFGGAKESGYPVPECPH